MGQVHPKRALGRGHFFGLSYERRLGCEFGVRGGPEPMARVAVTMAQELELDSHVPESRYLHLDNGVGVLVLKGGWQCACGSGDVLSPDLIQDAVVLVFVPHAGDAARAGAGTTAQSALLAVGGSRGRKGRGQSYPVSKPTSSTRLVQRRHEARRNVCMEAGVDGPRVTQKRIRGGDASRRTRKENPTQFTLRRIQSRPSGSGRSSISRVDFTCTRARMSVRNGVFGN